MMVCVSFSVIVIWIIFYLMLLTIKYNSDTMFFSFLFCLLKVLSSFSMQKLLLTVVDIEDQILTMENHATHAHIQINKMLVRILFLI